MPLDGPPEQVLTWRCFYVVAMQGSPVGEYAARLDLLAAFQRQLDAMASARSLSEDKEEVAAPRGARWQALSAVLFNVRRYYSQFFPAVQQQIGAGMAVQEKHLQDFVALAKWEDRGYYALRHSTEKTQRQLHRLWRRAVELLRQPASGPLQLAGAAMGFGDLGAPGLAAPGGTEAAAAGRRSKRARAAAATEPAAGHLAQPQAALAAFTARSQALVQQLDQAPLPALVEAGGSSSSWKYLSQLPRLSQRFADVVSGAVASPEAAAGVLAVDDLAGQAASRALELRTDVTKGAKARKKKALTGG